MRDKKLNAIVIALTLTTLPFVVLAVGYTRLPADIAVVRDLTGHPIRWATKSPITVFRVPVIGSITVLLAAVMRRRASAILGRHRRAAYSSMFSTFLIAAALKSVFEALEFVAYAGPPFAAYSRLFWIGTSASAVFGIVLALLRGRTLLASSHWQDWDLARQDKIALCALVAGYITVAVLPLIGSYRAGGR